MRADLLLDDVRLSLGDRPSAVTVVDGRIRLAGPRDWVLAQVEGAAVRVDGGGRQLISGFCDAHTHMLFTGLQALGDNLRLYDARSVEEIVDAVAAAARERPPGTWILGWGWCEDRLAEGRRPTRWDLDQATVQHPVLLHRVWNTCVVNSPALAAAGVDRGAAERYQGGRYAGEIETDPRTGEPTGLFTRRAKFVAEGPLPKPTPEQLQRAILLGQEAFVEAGICGVVEPGLLPHELDAYRRLAASGELHVRVRACPAGWGWPMLGDQKGLVPTLTELATWRDTSSRDERLRLDAVKIMVDGGVTDRSAWMREPYAGGGRGELLLSPEELDEAVRWCWSNGWPVDVHVCGDAALDLVLDTCSRLAVDLPSSGSRIHHAYFLDPERARRLPAGMWVVVNPVFLESEGASYVEALGAERADRMMPLRSLAASGVPLALGSDSPAAPYPPVLGVRAAVDRGAVAGRALAPGEALPLEVALDLATAAGSRVTGEADRGTIAPGQLADLVLLEDRLQDVVTHPPRIALTVIGGHVVHASQDLAATTGGRAP